MSAAGSFIELPDGVTHYELSNASPLHLEGAAEARDVILVHGFSVPYFIFDPTFEFLEHAGFRVLRYDLFGRGFSDRPRTSYNMQLFVKQLADLLNALHFGRPINLIGLSMGGPIAAAFTVHFPERVDKLILIDPAGARPIDRTATLTAAKMPILAELAFGLVGSRRMLSNIASDFFDPALVEHFQSRYKVQMQYKGFMRAILSTIRNGMLGSFLDIYQQVGKMDKSVLLFWGRDDQTVPFEHSTDLRLAMPTAEFHVLEHCGHIPHYEKPAAVNPLLLEFLRKK